MVDDTGDEALTGSKELVRLETGAPGFSTVIDSLPAILTSAGEDAITRFVEYFTVHIRNPYTRRAYFRNAMRFLRWCESQGVHSLQDVEPITVATYIELLLESYA